MIHLILLASLAQVTTDRTVDASSLESIVRDVARLSGAKSNDEKAIAIHTWLHQAIFHCAYPVEKAPQSVGPLKVIRAYGWGLCGGQHTVLKALFETAGWEVRYRGWSDPGHTTIEVKYDGRWHYFDVFLKCYFWTKDRKTIAGQDDIVADPSIVLDALKDGRVPADHYLCCGDEPEGIVQGCKNSKAHAPSKHREGWASVTGRDEGYDPVLTLPPGATLRLEWKGEAGKVAVGGRTNHSCGNKDYRSDKTLGPLFEHYGPRGHSNGRFVYAPDLSRPADRAAVDLGKDAAVYKMKLPYPFVDGRLEAGGKLSLSADRGKTWQPVEAGDVSALVRQKYEVWVRAEFSGQPPTFKFEGLVEHNRGALPHLLPGKNVVTATGVTATYAWQEAKAPEKRNRWDGQGVAYGETKTASGRGTFTIDVGGNTPPKMLYLELAPGESKKVRLFNGKDLDGLATWLQETKAEDPKKVFRVTDGLLHVSGEGNGYVATAKEYSDYRLVVEYKWGARTDGGKYVRNSGILLHATGPDGGAGKGAWMASLECQLAQGCVGDLIAIRSKDVPVTLTVDTVLGPDRRPRWKKGGTPTVYSGKQFWWSEHDPEFKELLDTRGRFDKESPMGEWTKVEVVCEGKKVSVSVNGTLVNEATDVAPAAGKILLQSEGFEIFFRTFELHPL